MQNALKKLSAEIKASLEASMASAAFKDLIASTKAADDSGTFEVVVSTADFDRSGESVDPTGMDLTLYKMNPIVLWGHDYYALPIGVCDSIEVIEGKIVAKGRFAPADANPFAQQVRKLYDAKIVRTTSIGFIVKEMDGNIITKGELLEFSFVPVPANPYALSLSAAKTLGLDVSMLAMKGLQDLMKKEETTEEKPVEEIAPVIIPAEEIVEEKTVSKKSSEENKVEITATLAEMQSAIDIGSQKIMAILAGEGEEAPEEEAPEEEAKAADDGVIPEDEAITAASGDIEIEQKKFEDDRRVMRALATATTNALEAFNKKSREHEAAK